MSFIDRLKGIFGLDTRNGGAPAISCEDALRRVHEFLDGELPGAPLEEIQAHFDACSRCYPHLRFERSFREAVRRAASRDLAPPELRDRLFRLLAEATEDG